MRPAIALGGAVVVVMLVALGVSWWLLLSEDASAQRGRGGPSLAAVAVGEIQRRDIAERRTFSGTLEPRRQFTVAPHVHGRVVRLLVDEGDTVQRGELIAVLDDEEYEQEEAQAQADLQVAQATLEERRSALVVVERQYQRERALRQDGLTSATALDRLEADFVAAQAAVAVAEATVERLESLRQQARIRRSYTQVRASWPEEEGSGPRLVTRRLVEAGDAVSARDGMIVVAEVDPMRAIFGVTEREFSRLQPGQEVSLRVAAMPDQAFPAVIHRLATEFDRGSRQAQMEALVENAEGLLRIGMYTRLSVTLRQEQDALVVPVEAPTRRSGSQVIFVIDEEQDPLQVRQIPVRLGIRDGVWQEIILDEDAQSGHVTAGARVITLGHQLLSEGTAVRIPDAGRAQEQTELR